MVVVFRGWCECHEPVKSKNFSQTMVSVSKGSTETHTPTPWETPKMSLRWQMPGGAAATVSKFVSAATPGPGSRDSGDFPAVHQFCPLEPSLAEGRALVPVSFQSLYSVSKGT